MLTFDRETHTYAWNGAPVVNVTRITDSLNDYAGIPEEVMRAAADRGDAVHYATELYDLGELGAIDDQPAILRPYIAAWAKFRADTGFEPVDIEARVFSEKYRYAGTLDRTGRFSRLKHVKADALCLLDIKATASLMPGVGPQTAAYKQAYEESRAARLKRRFAVQLKPDGDYRLEELSDQADLSVYLSAMTLHAWRERHYPNRSER